MAGPKMINPAMAKTATSAMIKPVLNEALGTLTL